MPAVYYASKLGWIKIIAGRQGLESVQFKRLGACSRRQTADPQLRHWVRQLDRYFAGTLKVFSGRFHLTGTAFEKQVYRQLLKLPYGRTASYGEIAGRLGRPRAWRALANAVARNPLLVIIPCHRVVRRDGRVSGYRGGAARKCRLLGHEKKSPTSISR